MFKGLLSDKDRKKLGVRSYELRKKEIIMHYEL